MQKELLLLNIDKSSTHLKVGILGQELDQLAHNPTQVVEQLARHFLLITINLKSDQVLRESIQLDHQIDGVVVDQDRIQVYIT